MDQLENIYQRALAAIENANNNHALDQLKSQYLGKSGELAHSLQMIKNLPLEQKKTVGARVNQVKDFISGAIAKQKENLELSNLGQILREQRVDVTLPSSGNSLGTLHPVTLTTRRMVDILKQIGFAVATGPEIETDYYNFTALNISANHPARAMQDTFYTTANHILRTHTSPIQVRYAKTHSLPIKVIAPGRVYRVDMDRTHSPMFHQLEGLWLDRGITFAHLKGLLSEFLRIFFAKPELQIRFRASFFPFTEPSAEIDIMDNNGAWLEVAGCGIVHPNVLQHMNVDQEQYNGFAFGLGIDRFAMLYYGIEDLRLMFDGDLDFLKQFWGL